MNDTPSVHLPGIRPTGNLVLLHRKRHADDVKVGLIAIPETGRGTVGECVVLAVGPGKWHQMLDPEMRDADTDEAILENLAEGETAYFRQELQVAAGDRVMISSSDLATHLGGVRIWPDHLPRPAGISDERAVHDLVTCTEETWLGLVELGVGGGTRDKDGLVDSDVDDVRLVPEEWIMCVLEPIW